VGDRKKNKTPVQKMDPDTTVMCKMVRNTNGLMDMLASLLLLSMAYSARTGPETFSGEESKPD